MDVQPEVIQQASLFLFEIGRWAASELKERWQLARKENSEEGEKVDISTEQDEQTGPQVEALVKDVIADQGKPKFERVLAQVERKRELILEWQEIKLDNEEEYNRQMIARGTLRIRQKELDEKISKTMREIETDLAQLNLQIHKEVAQ